jgi:hypothetical protein
MERTRRAIRNERMLATNPSSPQVRRCRIPTREQRPAAYRVARR